MIKRKIETGPKTAAKKPARKPRFRCPYSPEEVEEIFRRFSIQRPEPKGELEHVNPFTLLVAVALSAQATDVGVNKATRAAVCHGRHAAKDARRSARTPSATRSRRSAFIATRRRT